MMTEENVDDNDEDCCGISEDDDSKDESNHGCGGRGDDWGNILMTMMRSVKSSMMIMLKKTMLEIV